MKKLISVTVYVNSDGEGEQLITLIKKHYNVNYISGDKMIISGEPYVMFKCTPKTWKKIKKDLGLELTSVYSRFRQE